MARIPQARARVSGAMRPLEPSADEAEPYSAHWSPSGRDSPTAESSSAEEPSDGEVACITSQMPLTQKTASPENRDSADCVHATTSPVDEDGRATPSAPPSIAASSLRHEPLTSWGAASFSHAVRESMGAVVRPTPVRPRPVSAPGNSRRGAARAAVSGRPATRGGAGYALATPPVTMRSASTKHPGRDAVADPASPSLLLWSVTSRGRLRPSDRRAPNSQSCVLSRVPPGEGEHPSRPKRGHSRRQPDTQQLVCPSPPECGQPERPSTREGRGRIVLDRPSTRDGRGAPSERPSTRDGGRPSRGAQPQAPGQANQDQNEPGRADGGGAASWGCDAPRALRRGGIESSLARPSYATAQS